jgi:hypothetical protein
LITVFLEYRELVKKKQRTFNVTFDSSLCLIQSFKSISITIEIIILLSDVSFDLITFNMITVNGFYCNSKLHSLLDNSYFDLFAFDFYIYHPYSCFEFSKDLQFFLSENRKKNWSSTGPPRHINILTHNIAIQLMLPNVITMGQTQSDNIN